MRLGKIVALGVLLNSLIASASAYDSDGLIANSKANGDYCVKCGDASPNATDIINIRKLASEAPPRIQGDTWLDNPMTEIVRVFNGNRAETGWFGPECTVMTTLHALSPERAGHPGEIENVPEGALVGHKFNFITNPKPAADPNNLQPTDKKKLEGEITILAHGHMTDFLPDLNAEEDWALGRDESCMSEKEKLGFVKIRAGISKETMLKRTYMAPSFSSIPKATDVEKKSAFNGSRLYIDTQCKVQQHISVTYSISDCSLAEGGSGAPLTTTIKDVKGANGRLQLFADGMFQAGDKRFSADHGPNVDYPVGLFPFTIHFLNKISKYINPDENGNHYIATKNGPTKIHDSAD